MALDRRPGEPTHGGCLVHVAGGNVAVQLLRRRVVRLCGQPQRRPGQHAWVRSLQGEYVVQGWRVFAHTPNQVAPRVGRHQLLRGSSTYRSEPRSDERMGVSGVNSPCVAAC